MFLLDIYPSGYRGWKKNGLTDVQWQRLLLTDHRPWRQYATTSITQLYILLFPSVQPELCWVYTKWPLSLNNRVRVSVSHTSYKNNLKFVCRIVFKFAEWIGCGETKVKAPGDALWKSLLTPWDMFCHELPLLLHRTPSYQRSTMVSTHIPSLQMEL